MDQSATGDARGFPVEEEKNHEQEEDHDTYRPANDPESLKQHEHEFEDGVDRSASHGPDLGDRDPSENRKHDSEQEADRPCTAGRERKRGRACRVVDDGEAEPFRKRPATGTVPHAVNTAGAGRTMNCRRGLCLRIVSIGNRQEGVPHAKRFHRLHRR